MTLQQLMWAIRFRRKRYKQRVERWFAKPFYTVTVLGTSIKLGHINAYHHSVAKGMSKGHLHAQIAVEGFLSYPATLVYDVGGYNGVAGLLYAKRHPESEVKIFEPSHTNFVQIQQNIELNGLMNCEAVYAALGERSEKLKFSQGTVGAEGRSDYGDEVHVFALRDLPPADLVRTDCAGAEGAILRGLNYGTVVQLSVDYALLHRYGDSAETLWNEVRRLGLRAWFLHQSNVMSFYLLF